MGTPRKPRPLQVQRGFEVSRLEEQLWKRAYEQVWPLIRASIGARQAPAPPPQEPAAATRPPRLAQGA